MNKSLILYIILQFLFISEGLSLEMGFYSIDDTKVLKEKDDLPSVLLQFNDQKFRFEAKEYTDFTITGLELYLSEDKNFYTAILHGVPQNKEWINPKLVFVFNDDNIIHKVSKSHGVKINEKDHMGPHMQLEIKKDMLQKFMNFLFKDHIIIQVKADLVRNNRLKK